MFRKVKISERLPEVGKWVTTIDETGEHRVYRLVENGIEANEPYSWNMRDADGTNSPNNNIPLVYWLEEVKDLGEISDGYHSFNELYEFRKMYNAALFNEWAKRSSIEGGIVSLVPNPKYRVHKSWRHNDGELCFGGGWFIVSAMLPTGQISNHYKAEDWDLFKVPEVEKALYKFDGHTGKDVLERLKQL